MSLEKLNPEEPIEHKHSILIGKKMAYCMDCGKILLEYKSKKEFYRWLRSFEALAQL